jgi:hypothetical protein
MSSAGVARAYLTHVSELAPFKFNLGVADSGMYRADDSEHLRVLLHNKGIEFEGLTESSPDDPDSFKRQQLEAVKRWFYDDWRRIEANSCRYRGTITAANLDLSKEASYFPAQK